MKTKLTLTSKLLRTDLPPGAIESVLSRSALELERDIKTNIAESVPTGKTYRRGQIVRAPSKRTAGLKLKTRGGSVIVGFRFHRASRRGQAPAIDTGNLINSIRTIRVGGTKYRINVGAAYGVPLDDPDYLNRPFFTSRVERYRPRFLANVRGLFFDH